MEPCSSQRLSTSLLSGNLNRTADMACCNALEQLPSVRSWFTRTERADGCPRQGVRPLPAPQLQQCARSCSGIFPSIVERSHARQDRKFSRAGSDRHQRSSSDSVRLIIDEKTGLPRRTLSIRNRQDSPAPWKRSLMNSIRPANQSTQENYSKPRRQNIREMTYSEYKINSGSRPKTSARNMKAGYYSARLTS